MLSSGGRRIVQRLMFLNLGAPTRAGTQEARPSVTRSGPTQSFATAKNLLLCGDYAISGSEHLVLTRPIIQRFWTRDGFLFRLHGLREVPLDGTTTHIERSASRRP